MSSCAAFTQRRPPSSVWFEVTTAPGLPLYDNNTYSSTIQDVVGIDYGMIFRFNPGGMNKTTLGVGLFGVDHYRDKMKTEVTDLINEKGVEEFGSFLLNDWSEFRIGLEVNRVILRFPRVDIRCLVRCYSVLGSHSKKEYLTSDGSWVRGDRFKQKVGFALDGGTCLTYDFFGDNSLMGGFGLEVLGGFYPVDLVVLSGTAIEQHEPIRLRENLVLFRSVLRFSLSVALAGHSQ